MMRFLKIKSMAVFCILGFSLAGCQTVQQHSAAVKAAGAQDEKITVGTVQREIKVGMSSAEVITVLGSPNMVTTDSLRRENWVYDKISTERAYSSSSGGASILIIGGHDTAGAATTSQRTLTIIIKYDDNNLVRDFAYRYSSF